MNSKRPDPAKSWVDSWARAALELDRLRKEGIERADTAKSIELLDDAFESARLHSPPRCHSGLVEQQRLFHRKRP